MQGHVVLSHSRTFWRIIIVLDARGRRLSNAKVREEEGDKHQKQGGRRSRRALCRISRGIRVYRGGFHFLRYESTENGQLLGKYCVGVFRLQLCYQDNFHD